MIVPLTPTIKGVFFYFSIIFAFVYVFSGITKILSPIQFIKTSEFLFEKIFDYKVNFNILSILNYFLSLFEITIGILYPLKIMRSLIQWIFIIVNFFFIIVSLYLSKYGQLDTCGCMGTASKVFSKVHFPYLLIFTFLLILLLLSGNNNKIRIRVREGKIK